jgi:hypothetical protein
MIDNRVLSIRLELKQNIFTNLKLFVSMMLVSLMFHSILCSLQMVLDQLHMYSSFSQHFLDIFLFSDGQHWSSTNDWIISMQHLKRCTTKRRMKGNVILEFC